MTAASVASGLVGERPMAMPLRIGMVGPLPPPSGGMANQCRQLIGLLKADGLAVELVQTNLPYRPNFISGLRGVRAAFRLVPYLAAIWSLPFTIVFSSYCKG